MATHNYLNAARTQELINEIKTRLSGKADNATTISGYGITDAYTKTEVDTALSGKQATLVSGTNLKTINNESLLGSGNITVGGGGGSDWNISYNSSRTSLVFNNQS